MLRVGLTGSIAVGKSFVARVLAELGCFVLDADATAREVVAPGTPGLQSLVEVFGAEVLRSDGELDRERLAAMVFADAEKRKLLNSILHPLIIAAQDAWLAEREEQEPRGIAVIDAALMIETGSFRRFDKIIVVHCQPEVQLERLIRRNNLEREEAERRIEAQMPQAEKMRHADFLIDTSKSHDDTRRQVEAVYQKLEALAAPPEVTQP
ncbi:MAG: dephospho-CoA kinase [Acidobacteriota bacterium]|jgi:dephospho-CoA kinase|nr:dephospho-CoA kinase [Acidobacteriota bacterium]